MNAIFRDSLDRHSNVCHGCYKTIYTLATQRAAELGIPMIVTGLSRGQLFETRLVPQQFDDDRFDPDAIDRAVIEARKTYHRLDDGPNRLLDTTVFDDDDIFDRIEYLDFYRYVDVELSDLLVVPRHQRSVGPAQRHGPLHQLPHQRGRDRTHLQERGYHNYAIPYAWDVRLGHKTRQEAIEELDDRLDAVEVARLLGEVGYVPTTPETLTAWLEIAAGRDAPTPAELRIHLAEVLPPHAIPAAFVTVDELPLTTNGKLDGDALPSPDRTHRSSSGIHLAPESELETTIVAVWEQTLRIEPIGVDDDFFSLGGDSLTALEMIMALGQATGLALGDEFPFLHTTPRTLASAIEATGGEPSRDRLAQKNEPVTGPVWSDDHPPPLSDGELAILYEQSARPDSVMYNVGRQFLVDGPVDGERFAAALRAEAAKHVPLQWSYGANRRRLPPDEAIAVEVATEPVDEATAAELARALHRRRFDLDGGPLLRALVQPVVPSTGANVTTLVLLVGHHVSADADGFERLWADVDARLLGRPTPAPPIDYPTFSAWQRSTLSEADRDHWLAATTASAASSTIARPDHSSDDGFVTIVSGISPTDLRARAGTTGFAMAVTALTATLRRYHDGDRVSLGMITSSRNHPAAEPLVGYLLNTVPLVVHCDRRDQLDELTTRIGAAIATGLAHRVYPYSRIVADRREAGLDEPTVDVLVAYDELRATSLDGASVEQKVLSNGTAVADATFFFEVREDRVDLSLEHRGSVIDGATARQLLAELDTMLAAVVSGSDRAIDKIGDGLGFESVLVGPPLEHPGSVLPAILANMAERADQPAAECDAAVMTWAELDKRSQAISERLRSAGIGAGQRVNVSMARSVDLIAAIVGVLRSGAAYVPIDPTYPADRLALLRAGASAAATISVPGDIEIDIDITVDNPGVPSEGDQTDCRDAAYVIFTSGSTGSPRGVPVAHELLAASTWARNQVYGRNPERFLLVSSASFDSSIVGLFWTLATGGTIVLPTDRQAHDPDELLRLLDDCSITDTLMVPTLYQALLERGRQVASWPSQVIVAGEVCSRALVDRHLELRPGTRLTNEYGPTETTVWASAHHCRNEAGPVPIGGPVPGAWLAVIDPDHPDHAAAPVPLGTVGELIIGGAGVVDGYLDDPGASTARFRGEGDQRYFRTGDRAVMREGTVYFLGRLDEQLNVGGVRVEPEDIERVILDEPNVGAAVVTSHDPRTLSELIERAPNAALASAMAQASSMDDPAQGLARLLRATDPSGLRLVAHLEPSPTTSDATTSFDLEAIDLNAIRRRVTDHLPPLLRPVDYGVHASLPRTPNGKIDRRVAEALPLTRRRSATSARMATDPVAAAANDHSGDERAVEELAAMFADVLHVDVVDVDGSFFDLGGHSLLAMELLLRVERRFGQEITVSSLYDEPSPRGLAQLLRRFDPMEPQNRYLVPIQPDGTRTPIFGVHVLGVNSEFYRPLAERLGPDQPLFGLGQPTLTPDTSGPTDVAEVARCYADEIARCAPVGPLALAAVSLGSIVAFELAQQLRARGRVVTTLYLFDAAGPGAVDLAPSPTERIALHLGELRRRPLAYLGDRAHRLHERGGRRAEIASLRVRRWLGSAVADELRIRSFIEENWRSQASYLFAPYEGAVEVFKAGDDPFTQSLTNAGMGWADVVSGSLRVQVVPGGHLSMLAEPCVGELARLIADCQAAPGGTVRDAASTIGRVEVEASLRAALHEGRVGPEVSRWLTSERPLAPEARSFVDHVDRATMALAKGSTRIADEASAALTAAGILAMAEPVPERMQSTSAGIRLAVGQSIDRGRLVERAIAALEALGYRLQREPGEGAAPITALGACMLVRPDSAASRLRLIWDGGRPTEAEPVHYRDPRAVTGDLGIFLGTPTGLIGDVLDLAEPTADDVVVDIGCGDGRVLIEAARRFGCRARGIENNADLAARARSNVDAAGLADKVEILESDGSTADLGDATVVFVFLPAESTAQIVADVVPRLPAGGRLIAHEQLATAWPIEPDHSQMIVGDGLTVAYLWRAFDS